MEKMVEKTEKFVPKLLTWWIKLTCVDKKKISVKNQNNVKWQLRSFWEILGLMGSYFWIICFIESLKKSPWHQYFGQMNLFFSLTILKVNQNQVIEVMGWVRDWAGRVDRGEVNVARVSLSILISIRCSCCFSAFFSANWLCYLVVASKLLWLWNYSSTSTSLNSTMMRKRFNRNLMKSCEIIIVRIILCECKNWRTKVT